MPSVSSVEDRGHQRPGRSAIAGHAESHGAVLRSPPTTSTS
jgi:hypothetical protein